MAKGIYVGVNGIARKVKAQYVGVSGVARKVTKGYVGIGGVARKAWGEEYLPFSCTLTASFVTRFGSSYNASCSLDFTYSGGQYAAQGTISLQNGTTSCSSVRVTGVPANVRQMCSSMTINGANVPLSGSEYVSSSSADIAIPASGSSASVRAVLTVA